MSTVKPRLLLSFWDLCLDNLPEGRFERRSLPVAEARAMICGARENNALQCVSNDDLIAPYRQKQCRNHEALCAVLNKTFDIPLRLEDFLSVFDDKDDATQSVVPLQLARLQLGDRLLVVTCDFEFNTKTKTADLEERFTLAEDTVRFDLIAALAT